jgi:predicted ATPase
MSITDGEGRLLMSLGAAWIGPDEYAPRAPVVLPAHALKQLNLHEFKGHWATELHFSRMTMLVGDNGSGKTSVLDALDLTCNLRMRLDGFLAGGRSIPNLLRRSAAAPQMTIICSGRRGEENWSSHVQISHKDDDRSTSLEATAMVGPESFHAHGGGREGGGFGAGGDWDSVSRVIGSASMYRLRAERIAEAAYNDSPSPCVDTDGTDTAVVLASMKLDDDERFEIVEEAMRRLVPSFERVRIRREPLQERHSFGDITRQANKLYFDFQGAKDVPADGASHGTLILLSLLTTIYGPNRPNLLLIDDLEQALHPRAQRELVGMLKSLLAQPEFSSLQIVATTHSPYALDLLDPSEVYAFALRDDGTVASKRLSEHPDAETSKGTLTSGQLWSLDEERNWVLS